MKLGHAHAIVKGDGDLVWARVIRGLCPRRTAADVRRRQGRRRRFQAGTLVADPDGQIHVGVGADGSRLPEALLVLLGVEDRRPAPAAAHRRRRDRRNRRPAAARLPLHRARRRQFLSGDARRPGQGGAARRQDPARGAQGDARRTLRADGGAGRTARRHGVLHPDHDGSGRGSGFPRRDEEGEHQGRAGRRRSGHRRKVSRTSTRTSTTAASSWSIGCAHSATTACTCSGRSSSGCRAIGPRPSS